MEGKVTKITNRGLLASSMVTETRWAIRAAPPVTATREAVLVTATSAVAAEVAAEAAKDKDKEATSRTTPRVARVAATRKAVPRTSTSKSRSRATSRCSQTRCPLLETPCLKPLCPWPWVETLQPMLCLHSHHLWSRFLHLRWSISTPLNRSAWKNVATWSAMRCTP